MFTVRKWLVIAALTGSASLVFAGCSAGEAGPESVGKAGERIVFGADNRLEFGALSDPRLIGWANATGALFNDGSLSCSASACNLSTAPLTTGDVGGGTSLPLCQNERFLNQRAGAACTAFLVAPDLVATAGHCLQTQADCESSNLVFGFTADANGRNELTRVARANVYACVNLVAQVFSGGAVGDDWALFRVDRAVTGRTPLALRRTGLVANAAALVGIGHTLSLPLKISVDGAVRENIDSSAKFSTNLDESPGNSGSPVINLQSGLVEGILTSGPTPEWLATVQNGRACASARTCSDTLGCAGGPFPEWSDATRIAGVVAALEGRSCHDRTRNGQETDVDCGGPECTACLLGQQCSLTRDCPFRSVCSNSVCVPAPECVVKADCLDPRAPACIVAACTNNQCQLDFSACGCRTNTDCDDGRTCTRDLCFSSTLSCIHIESDCEPACTLETARDLGAPGNATIVPNNGCVRVRDGYPFWWGSSRTMQLQTTNIGKYPIPFTWTNTCAGSGGSGQFTGNWQSQFQSPTNASCATLIDLTGDGAGDVSLWYFGR